MEVKEESQQAWSHNAFLDNSLPTPNQVPTKRPRGDSAMRGLHHTCCYLASAASPSSGLCSTSLHPLIAQISSQTQQCGGRTEERCLVEADPSLQERLSSALAPLRDSAEDS